MAIRRREVLLGGLALAQLAAPLPLRGQTSGVSTRAAVVVGVNKTGDLPVLRAAAAGAKSVASWLSAEGFEVKLIDDDDGRVVTADSIKRAVTELVNRGTLTQLLIYFSGHGVAFGTSEFWLLTGAPDDLAEAVSVTECIDQANRSAIPNVVIICDACRSIPDFDTTLLHGTVLFPRGSFVPGVQSPDVDRFFGTRQGAPAYELKIAADDYAGVYTSTLLDAFKSPRAGMVTKVRDVDVISNRALKTFLLEEVPTRLKAANSKVIQYPDSKIESPESVYIGRATAQPRPTPTPTPTPTPGPTTGNITVSDIANHQFSLTRVGPLASLRDLNVQALDRAFADSELRRVQRELLDTKKADSFDTETGLFVVGAGVRAVWVAGDQGGDIVDAGDGRERPAMISIPGAYPQPVTTALMFEDGSGTVVAALPGFIGSLTVRNGQVTSVAYAPSPRGSRRGEYAGENARLEELRALAAASSKFGVFRIEGDKQARTDAGGRLANQIRVLKSVDPTLGLYAAYAYADANLPDQVRSVQSYMRGDLGADLFDVALLADKLTGQRIEGLRNSVVPFCPMLTQGWQLLRVREVTLAENVQRARDSLRPGLWTTFGPPGVEFIGRAIQAAR
ncbi:caspase family protein [Bradyrhizobium sp. 76]|uniref:caspase family protein n=1 Tax=Bradyrhizobium sp. 76 TaxID=2782680 RepID=UPI001FF9262D|nr:caspase family protein [Bradyrhizobium sp. 76]MCK1406834.1 caspase family protein [Bradyrhizobium sp. 76]